MKTIKIYPSLIAADPLHLGSIITSLESHCNGFHIDVMDNHFVPNLTWGPFMVDAIARFTKKNLFVHIMAENPLTLVEKMSLRAGDIVSFHIESINDFYLVEKTIKEKKLALSLAISPKTALEAAYPFLKVVDQILLMSVNPGFSGQSFLSESTERLKSLYEYKQLNGLTFEISMDGGVTMQNIHTLVQLGCTSFVVGSTIFNANDPRAALKELYTCAQ